MDVMGSPIPHARKTKLQPRFASVLAEFNDPSPLSPVYTRMSGAMCPGARSGRARGIPSSPHV